MSATLALDGGTPVRNIPLPLIRVSFDEREKRQIQSVLDAGVFCSVMPTATKVRQLEANFARYIGAKHAVAFSSGTTAQHASLTALDVGPGDDVIVPPLTFISTAYTVLLRGATVVFADVDEGTINLDPAKVAEKITPRTKAVVPVHWFGHPVDMDPLLALAQQHDLAVIEDCAHACGSRYHGRTVGTLGTSACWSLQESKLITAAGEGGMFTTDDDGSADAARMLRDHGKSQQHRPEQRSYEVVAVGCNYRMTEIQAAFAIAQLDKLDDFNVRRRAHTEYLDATLGRIPQLRRQAVQPEVELAYSYYPIRFLSDRFSVDLHRICDALTAEGIGCSDIGKHEMCHVHPLFTQQSGTSGQQYGRGTLPIAERIAEELLILPLYPDLTRRDLDDIIAAVEKTVAAYGK
jgi:dTDP-4-amino-4,6-dideoxygalactose transaminase